jgi:DNA-binding LacI/PurR family transcriptional regulator
LVSDGLLARHGRGYRQRTRSVRQPFNTILLIAAGTRGDLRLFSQRTHDLLRALEAQCAQRDLGLVLAPFEIGGPVLSSETVALLQSRSRPPLGALCFCPGLHGAQLADTVRQLQQASRPTALLDETTERRTRLPALSPPLRLFRAATNDIACREVARHLLGLGHRRMAYISPIVDSVWTVDRARALSEAVARAGTDATVLSYATTAEAAEGVLRDAGQRSELEQLVELNRGVRSLAFQTDLIMQREQIRPLLVPLMERALQDRSITAWVAANDNVALECLDYLKSRGVRVPRDLSLVGFDDPLEAFFRRITTYNYNAGAIVHAMLSHVLSTVGRRPRGAATQEPVVVEGFMNVRGSTAAARS